FAIDEGLRTAERDEGDARGGAQRPLLFLHGAPCHAAADFAIAGSALRRQRAKESEERDGGNDDSVDHKRNSDEPRVGLVARV
ncbi:MAG: hypothetical protein WBO09_23355, partial [Methylocystis silviterrae]|uniref:hypothetical protein n=1 Tax=Methylocystis silviterrae TaxID=2743612 RepID=UPI003C74EFFD